MVDDDGVTGAAMTNALAIMVTTDATIRPTKRLFCTPALTISIRNPILRISLSLNQWLKQDVLNEGFS